MAAAGFFEPDERLELIEGVIYRMTPQSSWHATAVLNVQEALRSVMPQGCHMRSQLPMVLGQLSEPEPDLAVVLGSRKDYRDAHPTTALLVVEISDSSAVRDRELKAAVYAGAGIPEYWILYRATPRLEIFRNPQGGTYREHRVLQQSDSVSPFAAPSTSIRVADLLP